MREKSEVWRYFTKLLDSNQILCKLCAEKFCKNCSKENPCKLQGFNPSNAKKHLKFIHPDESKIVEEMDNNKDVIPPKKIKLCEKAEPIPTLSKSKDFFKPRQPLTFSQ
jgi:hypothetical protein